MILMSARLFFALLTLTAIGTQLVVHVHLGFSLVNFFSYFTNLSNLFAAVVLLGGALSLLRHREPTQAWEIIRGTSVVCMALVGVVFGLLLSNEDLGSLLPWVNIVLHYLMPVVMVLDWLVQPPQTKLVPKQIGFWLIFPLLYVLYSLIRGSRIGWYAYPFFDPTKVGGYGGVALYCVGILLAFLILSWLLIAVGNRFQHKPA